MMMMMMVVVVAVSKANDASLRFVALANFWLLPTAGSREFVSLEHGKIIKAVLGKKKMLVNKSPTADKKKTPEGNTNWLVSAGSVSASWKGNAIKSAKKKGVEN